MSISKNSQNPEASTNQTFKTQRLIIEILFWLIIIIVLVFFILAYTSFVDYRILQIRNLSFVFGVIIFVTLRDYEFNLKLFLKRLIFKDSPDTLISKHREKPTKKELTNKVIFWTASTALIICLDTLYFYFINEQEQQLLTTIVPSISPVLTCQDFEKPLT